MNFSELVINQCFIDTACGGIWRKLSAFDAACMETDAVYITGELAGFKDTDLVSVEVPHLQLLECDDSVQKAVGLLLRNALALPQMRETLRQLGKKVFAVKDESDYVLAISVDADLVCNHVVGSKNAPPTSGQLAELDMLCRPLNIIVSYDLATPY